MYSALCIYLFRKKNPKNKNKNKSTKNVTCDLSGKTKTELNNSSNFQSLYLFFMQIIYITFRIYWGLHYFLRLRINCSSEIDSVFHIHQKRDFSL